MKAFIDWAKENGIEQPNQEFPAYFEDGNLVGVRALKPIPFRQAFIKVPYKCVFSATKARQNQYLKQIIDDNPKIFKDQFDADTLILVLFLVYESQKGDDSFWKPWLDAMPLVDLFCHWPDEVIDAT